MINSFIGIESLKAEMMSTCLFTGEELQPDTKVEHTIPESVGGRILSTIVSSSKFNESCGSFCDDSLREAYGFLLTRLSPMLPAASQPGLLKAIAEGAPDGLTIEPGGVLTRRSTTVLEKDLITGRPKSLIGPDEQSVRKFAKNARMPADLPITNVPLTHQDVLTVALRALSPEFELAALKSILLSFDHLLSHREDRFTRGDHLDQVRSMVKQSVESKVVNSDLLGECSLGAQFEKVELYSRLRAEIPVEETPFEHIMLVCGNHPQRCLDVVWIMFGFEPWGFRLSNSFDEADFCLGFVNPVIKGHPASRIFDLIPPDELLCRPTERKSFQTEESIAVLPQKVEQMAKEILDRRVQACDRALFEVQIRPESEDWVLERLSVLQAKNEFQNISDLLAARILDLYPNHNQLAEFQSKVKTELQRQVESDGGKWNEMMLRSSTTSETWSLAIAVFRRTLSEIRNTFGMPGGGYFADLTIGDNEQKLARLGFRKS